MNIYLYQLKTEVMPRLSLSIQVDLHYWNQKGKSIQSIYKMPSIHQANRCQANPKKIAKRFDPIPYPSTNLDAKKIHKLATHLFDQLQGRAVLSSELNTFWNRKHHAFRERDFWAAIQWLYLQNKVQIRPGVEWGRFALFARCHRCFAGSSHISWRHCATCGDRCAMCNHCLPLGRSSSCSPLFLFSARHEIKKRSSITLRLPHPLTPWQQRTVQKMDQFLTSPPKELLFWAVTGAGKTECMVPVIKTYLERGQRVVWVSPRKDVVLEVAPRLKHIFPTIQPIALYGGSPQRWQKSSLIIATAHQTYRFVDYFDLGIIDEVDAFPLYQNHMLESGIRRALIPSAKMILLTATPPKSWKRLVKERKCSMVVLPIRYHGHPLPVPTLKLERRLWKKVMNRQSIRIIEEFIQHVLQTDGQAILFVPRLQDIFHFYAWLEQKFSSFACMMAGVYAQDPERDQKIRQFREGRIRFLISTSILERGVTVKRCHVAVIGADHPIFDQATLVQMAGRVGRSASYQQGEVWFIAQEKTDAQLQSQKEIIKLNQSTKKEGFLSEELYYLW